MKKIAKTLNQYSGILTLGVAILSFLVAYLQALYFAHGQTELANYVIQKVGIVPMWTGALVLVISAILQTIFLIELIKTKGDISARFGLAVGCLIYIFMWQVLPLLFIITIIVAIIGARILRWVIKKKSEDSLKEFKFRYFAFIVATFILLGVSNFPLMPSNVITLNNDKKILVREISRDDGGIIVVDEKDKKVSQLKTTEIKDSQLCSQDKIWIFYTLYDVIIPDQRRLPRCPEV